MQKRVCTLLGLVLCLSLLVACVQDAPQGTQSGETTQHEAPTEPPEEPTDDSKPSTAIDDGFSNDPAPEGTKRY